MGFVLLVMLAAAYGIYYATAQLSMIDMAQDTVENSINCKTAYIIREERVFEAPYSGSVYHSVSDGERVSKDSLISTVFSGKISSDKLKELRTIDRKIQSLKSSEFGLAYVFYDSDTESAVNEIISEIPALGEKNEVSRIAGAREDLNAIRSGVSSSPSDRLDSLLEQKQIIQDSISAQRMDIITDISGVFTTYADGMESALIPEDIPSYGASYISSLKPAAAVRLSRSEAEAGGAVCKVMNNHLWYVIMNVPLSRMDGRKVGDDVWLRFNSMAGEKIGAQIYYIGEPENDIVPVTVRCGQYLEGAFAYRSADVDLIFESYSGCRVPIQAIRSDNNGNKYVLGMIGTREYICYCTVLYSDIDRNIAIIESTQTAQNKIQSMERIVTGER
ncbi:MAG: HlyD family efflux transporter periplasmic adaptor subunit [Clostridiales bacterium]|nr:HlyD family efflux transporter periplasmic adaptor subunit [Clostridiales bacterium]